MIYMKIKSKKTNKSQEQQKETNSAEQDNLYNRVNAYKSQKEKKHFGGVC